MCNGLKVTDRLVTSVDVVYNITTGLNVRLYVCYFSGNIAAALLCSYSQFYMHANTSVHCSYTQAHIHSKPPLVQRRRCRRRCFHFFSPQQSLSKRIWTPQRTVVLNGKKSEKFGKRRRRIRSWRAEKCNTQKQTKVQLFLKHFWKTVCVCDFETGC